MDRLEFLKVTIFMQLSHMKFYLLYNTFTYNSVDTEINRVSVEKRKF